jgi:hypothetical protein
MREAEFLPELHARDRMLRAMTIATVLDWVPDGVGGDIFAIALAALVFAALWALVRGLEHV